MDESQNELVGPVREFLDRALTVDRRTAMLKSDGSDPKLWEEVGELGWFALTAPEDDEGLGMHPSQLGAVFRTFGERLLTGPMLEQMVLPGLCLAGSASADRPAAARFRRMLTGDVRLAVADPGATMHWADANGSLRFGAGGVDGTLEVVRFAAEADELLLVGEDAAGPLVVLVDSGRPGLTVTPRPSADPGAAFARLSCRGVQFAIDDVVARGGAAEDLVAQLRAWQRVFLSCELAGISRRMLDLALEYIGQREQFGRTISTFQAVRHIAATAAQRTILLENFCEAVAADAPSLSLEELGLAAMTLKATASETARLVVEDALQMHGGIGFTYEYELHWYYKRALSLRTWYGDERELAVEVGRRKLTA